VSWNWVNLKVTMKGSATRSEAAPHLLPVLAMSTPTMVGRNIVEFVGDTMADVDPCPRRNCVYSAIMGQGGVFAYSGMAFTAELGKRGSLVLTGGGHGDYWGNEVYVFDLATNRWRRINNPSLALDGTNAETDPRFNKKYAEYGDGTPGSSHTYDHLRCVPGKNELLLIGSAACYGAGPSSYNGYAHACNLTTGAWRRASTNGPDMKARQACSIYDERRKKAWRCLASNGNSVAAYDPETETFAEYVPAGAGDVGFDPIAFGHPGFDLMVVLGWTGGYNLPSAFTLTAIQLGEPAAPFRQLKLVGDIPTSRISFTDTGWGVDWSTDHNAAFVFAGEPDNSHVYRIDPPATNPFGSAWTLTKIALPQPMPGGVRSGIYSHWRYCSTIKKFAFVANPKSRVALWTP